MFSNQTPLRARRREGRFAAMRTVTLAALLAFAASTATAAASTTTVQITDGPTFTSTQTEVTDTRLASSVRLAKLYWGRLPNCRDLKWLTMIAPPGDTFVGAARGECERWVDPAWIAQAPKKDVCTIVIHEIGHNLGYKHWYAGDRARVMQGGVPAICRPRRIDMAWDRRWCRHEPAACLAAAPRLHAYVTAATARAAKRRSSREGRHALNR